MLRSCTRALTWSLLSGVLLLWTGDAFADSLCGASVISADITVEPFAPEPVPEPEVPGDFDQDGIADENDICPFAVDPGQDDLDGDGFGDACDNCPDSANVEQADADGDILGNACDNDADNDGVLNNVDSCYLLPNPGQLDDPAADDADGDGVGNLCDPDDDNDGALDVTDPCPLLPGVTDPGAAGCDNDSDDDGIPDSVDTCPFDASDNNRDSDGDMVGDACDADLDNDGAPNLIDNCRTTANAHQLNGDHDGFGDACDPTFCYVIDSPDSGRCLDPQGRFMGRPGPELTVAVGERVPLRIYTNRPDAATQYSWQVVGMPSPVAYELANAAGTANESWGWELRYPEHAGVTFVAHSPGEYTLELRTSLVADDARFPGLVSDQQTLRITADGAASDCPEEDGPPEAGWLGCGAFGDRAAVPWLVLLGALGWRLRWPRR